MQVRIGRLQLAAGNPEGASYNVQKALQGRPDDVAALALMVEVEARRGDAAKADAALKTLAAKHPNRVETALATANLALQRGQYPAAIAAYRTALAREESTANALGLASAHVAAGEFAKAATFLDGLGEGAPERSRRPAGTGRGTVPRGAAPGGAGQLRQGRRPVPDDAMTLNNYANLLLQLNDPAAQATAEQAVKLAPDNPNLCRHAGVDPGAERASGRRTALPARRAAAQPRRTAEIRFHLAWTLNKLGRQAEAKEELAAAIGDWKGEATNPAMSQLKKELGL